MLELDAAQIQQPVHTGLTKTCILSQKSFKISFATLPHIKMYRCSFLRVPAHLLLMYGYMILN